jgi:mannose-6-phosphate isomerase class I
MRNEAHAYRTHPVHIFPDIKIATGYSSLARTLLHLQRETNASLIIIDGYVGIDWEHTLAFLQDALRKYNIEGNYFSTQQCFRSEDEIEQYLAPFLTDDPVLGRIFPGHIEELWNVETVANLKQELAQEQEARPEQLHVLYGFGASAISKEGIQVYIDVPKDEGQKRAGQKAICNVGASSPGTMANMYKRFYFVDWPMLNRLKRAMLPRMNIFVDATSTTDIRWITGRDFRRALHALARQPFRVKPWFAPGPWGGQWMKEQFGLDAEQPNYAWSFELIAPENGILLGNEGLFLECAFDCLLWQETDAVLGTSVAARYGSYFPIRFDYLDTMSGTNLSCQVHPRVDYIRTEFGEPFTQDETYYIVKNKAGSQVFLGLREDIHLDQFRADAQAARDKGIPFEITDHVNSFSSHVHDLFLIPSGTVHCSGANNLVLEISATPYIYTFKIYDYLRRDLSGNLRHVHLEHAFANIAEERKTRWVEKHLMPQPTLLCEGNGWQEYEIGNIEHLFFAISRLEFSDTIEDETRGRFHALNMVEGDCCEILTENNAPVELRFAESCVLPASVGRYRLKNKGTQPCKVVKAFVK